jgi:hypothetical protein
LTIKLNGQGRMAGTYEVDFMRKLSESRKLTALQFKFENGFIEIKENIAKMRSGQIF